MGEKSVNKLTREEKKLTYLGMKINRMRKNYS